MELSRGTGPERPRISLEYSLEWAEELNRKFEGTKVGLVATSWLEEPSFGPVPVQNFYERMSVGGQALKGEFIGIGCLEMPRYGDSEALPVVSMRNASLLRPDGTTIGSAEANRLVVVRFGEITGPLEFDLMPETELAEIA
ncbi:hypothetical protein COU91_02545 [Candidatus Saccharibacteria bacterium CG10_big_fil_rev_8_21_14_0_10_47_8]|nr:MAG: hypothetical protein COU91_02545 [Candidatus Saccharibacteria bacterium CG10_big_fil_rev_8_21_14_0_10_47_8]